MADRVGRGRSRVIVGRRQPTNWSRSVIDYVTVPFGNKVLVTSLVLSNTGINETIRRTRGVISVRSDTVGVQETQLGAFGAIVVTAVAAGLGVASLPSPVTQRDDDGWLLWVPIAQQTGRGVGEPGYVNYMFDSKAMRKVSEGFVVSFIVENSDDAHGLDIALGLSVLTSRS